LGPVNVLLCLVTTGLDPVVHADSLHTRRCPMDCRIKSGNDGWKRRHFTVDTSLYIGYTTLSRPPKGRVLEAHLNTGRVRFPRADLHSALGRLRRIRPSGTTTGTAGQPAGLNGQVRCG
jgi:hypothetical protein